MSSAHGRPIWYELQTPDPAGARAFYADLVGWSAADQPTAEGLPPYTILSMDGAGVGGLVPVMPGSAGPGWFPYFHVADVDAKAAEVTAAGGTVTMGGYDIPHVGRIALVADPQGAPFYLMAPTPPPGMEGMASTSFHATLPGRCAWNELVTSDEKAALPFYRDLLGWTSNGAMPMGPAGDYTFIDLPDEPIGAMMNRQSPEQPLGWRPYFKVPDAARAAERVTAGGGTVVAGPMEVPGGQQVVMAIDPQGCGVGFVSGERA